MTTAMPWAILLCRYNDDTNNPSVTTIAQLAAQWRLTRDAQFLAAGNINPSWDTDNRTILELCETFFTISGLFTFNTVRYWDENSHGSIYTGDSQVFPCVLDRNTAQADARAQSPGGDVYQDETFVLAKKALLQQHGKNWRDFPGGVAVVFQSPDYGGQGGAYDGGTGVFMDIRYVKNNGLQSWGQEMGHAFGMDHSRTDGVFELSGAPEDYTDPWDGMSTRQAMSSPDSSYGMRGPGMNAWNMRGRGWLDESRVWRAPPGNFMNHAVNLRPLHKRYLPGYLAAELPGVGGHSQYLVEFRVPDDWDAGIVWPKILVHRFEGSPGQFLGNHSYIMRGTAGQSALGVGEIVEIGSGPSVRVKVLNINEPNAFATVELCYSSLPVSGRTVKIVPVDDSAWCYPSNVEGRPSLFGYELQGNCLAGYQVNWSGDGIASLGSEPPGTGPIIAVMMPAGGTETSVTLTLTFDDGFVVTDTLTIEAITEAEANWHQLICSLLNERKKPNPWWEWNPAAIHRVLDRMQRANIRQARERLARIAESLERL